MSPESHASPHVRRAARPATRNSPSKRQVTPPQGCDDSDVPRDKSDPFEMPEHPGKKLVPEYLWSYANASADLAAAADELRRYLADLAAEASIQIHTIEARAKTLQSYAGKALKTVASGAPKYLDPASEIKDCIAARVILFTTRARDDYAEVLLARAPGALRENPGDLKHNGYDSVHIVIIELNDAGARARYPALARYLDKYPGPEIQLRSVAAHAWAEYEHDIRYKPGAYESLSDHDRGQVDQWFVEAGGLRRFMDELFDRIYNLLYPADLSVPAPVAPEDLENDEESDCLSPRPLDVTTLAELIRSRFSGLEPGEVASIEELCKHLRGLSITTVSQVEAVLGEIDGGQVARLMDYPTLPTGIRRLDDELLAALQDDYVDAATDDARRQLLRLRLRRVRGRFSVYSIDSGDGPQRPVPAARAVRDLTVFVANEFGVDSVVIDEAIALNREELAQSTRPRVVKTTAGQVFVATNLSRASAESLLETLVARAPGSGLRVLRAGDLLFEAWPNTEGDEPAAAPREPSV